MLSRFKFHLMIALAFFVLTLSQQYLFCFYKGIPIMPFSFAKYLGIFAFFLGITFIHGFKTRFFFLSLVLFLNFFQMAHLSYFGTQILPSEFFLLFTQSNEMFGTLKEELGHIFVPLLFTLVPMILGWQLLKKAMPLYGKRWMSAIFILYLIYNPVRTYMTGNTWGRQPSTRELSGLNLYLSLSYFLGKILPHKFHGAGPNLVENSSMRLKLIPNKTSPWKKIILVLGESLTPNHMQLFGYRKATTPFLNSLKGSANFYHIRGLSSGVSTDISVAFFLNMAFGDAGSIKSAKGTDCLFKLAKDRKFSTSFFSVQSAQQLRYIIPYLCSSSIDSFKSLEDIAPNTKDHQAAKDRDLLPALKILLEHQGPQFIMLHQRGSHAPWNLRYTEEAKKFSMPGVDERVSDYDNSVFEFDLFWKELNGLLINTKEPTLVVYISDHGEALGEDGHWGHGQLRPTSFEVPIMVESFNGALPPTLKDFPEILPQYNLALLLAQEMGLGTNQQPAILPLDYQIYGNDIDGFAGKVEIKFLNNNQYGYDFKLIP